MRISKMHLWLGSKEGGDAVKISSPPGVQKRGFTAPNPPPYEKR